GDRGPGGREPVRVARVDGVRALGGRVDRRAVPGFAVVRVPVRLDHVRADPAVRPVRAERERAEPPVGGRGVHHHRHRAGVSDGGARLSMGSTRAEPGHGPDVTVVVVNYNGGDDLTRCVRSAFDAAGVAADHPRAGAIGCLTKNPDGTVYPSARKVPSTAEAVGHAFLGPFVPGNRWSSAYTMAGWDRRSERQVEWVSGSSMLLRRAALD